MPAALGRWAAPALALVLVLVLVLVHLGRTGPRVHRALRLWLYSRQA